MQLLFVCTAQHFEVCEARRMWARACHLPALRTRYEDGFSEKTGQDIRPPPHLYDAAIMSCRTHADDSTSSMEPVSYTHLTLPTILRV